jgi:hypothetical protein
MVLVKSTFSRKKNLKLSRQKSGKSRTLRMVWMVFSLIVSRGQTDK